MKPLLYSLKEDRWTWVFLACLFILFVIQTIVGDGTWWGAITFITIPALLVFKAGEKMKAVEKARENSSREMLEFAEFILDIRKTDRSVSTPNHAELARFRNITNYTPHP